MALKQKLTKSIFENEFIVYCRNAKLKGKLMNNIYMYIITNNQQGKCKQFFLCGSREEKSLNNSGLVHLFVIILIFKRSQVF